MPLNTQELEQIYAGIRELGASTEPPEMRREKAARLINAIKETDGIPEVDHMKITRGIMQHGWPPNDTLTTLLNLGYYDKKENDGDEAKDNTRRNL